MDISKILAKLKKLYEKVDQLEEAHKTAKSNKGRLKVEREMVKVLRTLVAIEEYLDGLEDAQN